MTDAHQTFVRQVARHDPEGAMAVEKELEKRDEKTAAIDDASLRALRAAEEIAQLTFARQVFRKGKRKPEGNFNGDTGRTEPERREDVEWTSSKDPWPGGAARARTPAFFTSWNHVYRLCMAACKGRDVPTDIAHEFATRYPKIHESYMKDAVDARLKNESEAHDRAKRKEKLAEAEAVASSREGRLAKRKEQLIGLERLLKKQMAKEAALRTRMRKVKASIRMLERKP